MNLSIRELEYILTVASENSITRAAQKLHIAQPSLSQALKKVEEEIGMPLFCRIRNRMQPTQVGELMVDSASKVLKIVQDMETSILDIAQLNTGRLRIGLPYYLGSFLIPPAIRRYREQYGDVELQFVEADAGELEEMLLNGTIDLAVMPLPLETTSLVVKPFFSGGMVLLIPRDSPLNELAYDKGDKKRYFDLHNAQQQPFIMGRRASWLCMAVEEIFQKVGIDPDIALYAQNIETIKRFVSAGGGAAILPELYLARYPGGRIDADSVPFCYYYLEPEQNAQWAAGAAYLDDAFLSFAARRFAGVLDDLYSGFRLPEPV